MTRRLLPILLIACISLPAATGCWNKLSEADVKAAYQRVEDLYRSREYDALKNLFLPEARIAMIYNGERTEFTVEEYLQHTMTGMRFLTGYEIASNIESISLDGKQATVVSTVIESGVMMGEPLNTETRQTAVYAMHKGEILIRSLTGEVVLK